MIYKAENFTITCNGVDITELVIPSVVNKEKNDEIIEINKDLRYIDSQSSYQYMQMTKF